MMDDGYCEKCVKFELLVFVNERFEVYYVV